MYKRQQVNLNFFDISKPIHLYTDASRVAGAGCLFTESATGELEPLMYHSRKWSRQQSQSLNSLELEVLCVLDCLTRLSYYTRHTAYPIRVHTDAKCIVFLLNSHFSSDNPKLERASAKLLSFDLQFEIIYTKPTDALITMADALSRQHIHADLKTTKRDYRAMAHADISHPFKVGESVTMEQMLQHVRDNPLPIKNKPPSGNIDATLPADETILTIEETSKSPVACVRHIFSMFDYLTIGKIVEEQSKDPAIRAIVDKLMTTPDKQDSQFWLYNNLLTKRRDPSRPFSPSNVVIMAPRSLYGDLLGYFHILSGHVGAQKLHALLASYYFVPAGLAKAKQFCKGCVVCQLCQPAKRRREYISGPERGQFSGDLLALDHAKMPNYSGYKYLLFAVDSFSNYTTVYPVTSLEDRHVAKLSLIHI